MRDGQILAMHQQSGRRQGLALARMEYLKLRQDASDSVIVASSLKDRVRWLFKPAEFIKTVNEVHDRLLLESEKELAAAQEAAKTEKKIVTPVRAPIQVVRG